jgi:hypothetical protein
VHIAAIGTQVQDWIPDDLSGTVIGHVAAATGFANVDTEVGQTGCGRDNVRPTAIAFDAYGDHGRMLKEKEKVRHLVAAPLFNERTLQVEGILISHNAQPPDLKRLGHWLGLVLVELLDIFLYV